MTALSLLLLACVGDSAPVRVDVVDNPLPACADYAHDEATYGFCLLKTVQKAPMEEARTLCEATDDVAECRHQWVSMNRSEPTVDALLAFCMDDDCRLEVLDARPAELAEQMELCRRHAGRLGPDCAGHAGQRWASTATPEDIEAAATLKVAYPGKLAWWIGVALHCGGHASCEGMPAGCEPGRSWASANAGACGGGR